MIPGTDESSNRHAHMQGGIQLPYDMAHIKLYAALKWRVIYKPVEHHAYLALLHLIVQSACRDIVQDWRAEMICTVLHVPHYICSTLYMVNTIYMFNTI